MAVWRKHTRSLGLGSHLEDARGAARGAGGVEAHGARGGYGGAGEEACEHGDGCVWFEGLRFVVWDFEDWWRGDRGVIAGADRVMRTRMTND
tara:strand:- start:30864 stop:31139 length:276 start_codon:yes stop_codon:yes gene_type:complete